MQLGLRPPHRAPSTSWGCLQSCFLRVDKEFECLEPIWLVLLSINLFEFTLNRRCRKNWWNTITTQVGMCERSVVAAVLLEGLPQCVCVGECKRTVSLWKTSMKQHFIWFTVCAYVWFRWEVTYKRQRNVPLLSALWCCIVIHHKPWQRLCVFAISLAAFPPSLVGVLPSAPFNGSTLPPSGNYHPWPHFGVRLTAPDACSQCATRGQHCRCRCHGGVQKDESNHSSRAWRGAQFLMSGHQINNLFISLTRGNVRVMCCSNKSIVHVVTHCAKSLSPSMITFYVYL